MFVCVLSRSLRCCDVSTDGTYFALSCNGFNDNGCEALLYDRRNLTAPLATLRGHTQSTRGCACLSSSLLATASQDGTLRVWDRDSAECVAVAALRGQGGFTAVCVTDTRTLLTSTFNGGLQRWLWDGAQLQRVAAVAPALPEQAEGEME